VEEKYGGLEAYLLIFLHNII